MQRIVGLIGILVFLIIASVLNIFFDVLFITRFKMNVEGTAIATVIAQGLSALLCLIYILMHKPLLIPSISDFKVDLSFNVFVTLAISERCITSPLASGSTMFLIASIFLFCRVLLAVLKVKGYKTSRGERGRD